MAAGIIFAVTLVFVSAVSLSSCEEATVGVNFQYVFEKENFFGRYSLGPDQPGPVVYKPSLVGKPGLPRWLRYVQTDPARRAFIYGTPSADNVGDITLEVIALNTNTYQSARVKVLISVTEQSDPPRYLATFFLSNQNVADMLPPNRQQEFLRRVDLVWCSQTPLFIHQLRPASDVVEVRNPLPTDAQEKEGVYLTIGSATPFSQVLLQANATDCTSGAGDGPEVPRGAEYTGCISGTYEPRRLCNAFEPDFVVRWSSLELTQPDPSSQTDGSSGPQPITLGNEYTPPALPSQLPTHLIEFLLIVVPPLVVALIFVIVLGCLMCTCRGGSKGIARTPEIQLAHHQGIRQASRQLRALSNRRDAAPSSSPTTPIIPHGANPAVSSVQSSPRLHIRVKRFDKNNQGGPKNGFRLQDHNPDDLPMTSTPMFSRMSPPPYRTPPQHASTPTTPGHQETSFSGDPFDSRRLSEPGNPRGRPAPSPIRTPPPFMSGSSSRGYPIGGSTS